ncbi:PD-(D/E)XK nuclease [Haloarcula tailed virus 2]|uniref:PD-(D/E)XK nuclease n=1 Tax=Haloarcula tailed virus 2 TaxID=2877989 RepID=A0AAE9BY41_9CAUD|nr:PD-(D/E)XK nuclease [Haloarcula tailed virus 2]UBF23185.1 PD-(D/E)XK nuclease [Haloarcula tailed virus 2]
MIQREMDDEGRRWYVLPNGERRMSVTTILGHLKEDKTGLKYWQRKHNGRGDAADHRHLLWYMTYRGTMCHYQALKKFEDIFDSGDVMYGDGEREALGDILAENTNKYKIYSVLKYQSEKRSFSGQYDDYEGTDGFDGVDNWEQYYQYEADTTLSDLLWADVDWFVDTFEEIMDKLGITEESVISVEKYLFEDEYGFGGQCDLLYEDPDGNVVLADLKTSGGLRQKHVIQASAYRKAVEAADDIPVDTVDRMEVIRIHPDSRTYEIHSDQEASENHTTKYWFKDKYGNWEYNNVEEQWEQFKELAEKAHGGEQ